MASWWASLVLRVIKLRPSLWSEECSIKQLTSSSCWGFHSVAQRHCHLCLEQNQGPALGLHCCFLSIPRLASTPVLFPRQQLCQAASGMKGESRSGGLATLLWPRDPGVLPGFGVNALAHCTVLEKVWSRTEKIPRCAREGVSGQKSSEQVISGAVESDGLRECGAGHRSDSCRAGVIF